MSLSISTTTLCLPSIQLVTTVFTPPSWCRDEVITTNDVRRTGSALSLADLMSCYPGPPIPSASRNSWSNYPYYPFYSPAICPSGYSIACSRLEDHDRSWDPLPRPGETAAICCPRGFVCNSNFPQTCISGPRFEATSARQSFTEYPFSARGIQIRWQASDLSRLATPPLTTTPPGQPNRFGWNPAGALTGLYSCPPITNSTTGTCGTLTGNYYSPAICPLGWTAAHSRPFTESMLGPPEALQETAMLCCPRCVPFVTCVLVVSNGSSCDLIFQRIHHRRRSQLFLQRLCFHQHAKWNRRSRRRHRGHSDPLGSNRYSYSGNPPFISGFAT